MKLNSVEIVLKQLDTEQVDGVLIARDRAAAKVLLFNETSSVIWRALLDRERRGVDIATADIVTLILETCNLPDTWALEVAGDVEEILHRLSDCGLICEVGREEVDVSWLPSSPVQC